MRIRSCADCGKVLPDEALFCGQCGKAQQPLPPATARNTGGPPSLASNLASTMIRPSTVPDPKKQDEILETTAATGQPSPELLNQAKPSETAVAAAPKYDPTKTVLDLGPPPAILAEHAPPTPPAPTPPLTLNPVAAPVPPANLAAPPPAAPPRAVGHRTVVGFAAPAPLARPAQPIVAQGQDQMQALAETLASNQHVPAVTAPAPQGAPVWLAPSKNKTMLGGVAAPPADSLSVSGRAAATLPSNTPVYPAADPQIPAPPAGSPRLENDDADPVDRHEPPPPSQRISSVIVLACALLFVACLVAVVLFVRTRKPGVTARALVDESGTEVLRVRCPGCPDGATVSIGSSSAKVNAEVAQLRLAEPLQVGANRFSVTVEGRTPGSTETTSIPILLPYRVRADFSTVRLTPSVLTVRVEAEPGSTVSVSGTPVALDASGRGAFPVDVSSEVRSENSELSLLERSIPYTVKVKGEPEEKGTLIARAKLLPLKLSTPIDAQMVPSESFILAGRTLPGASITIDGHAAAVDTNGAFGVNVKAAALGERTLEIVTSQDGFAARVVRVSVHRIADIAESAKALEASSPLTYRSFSTAPREAVGKTVVVEGDVVEARVDSHRTLLLIADRRDCPRGASCFARFLYGSEEPLKVGERVRAFGRLYGTIPRDGTAIPDVQAILVARAKP